jgi:hypothetical protein
VQSHAWRFPKAKFCTSYHPTVGPGSSDTLIFAGFTPVSVRYDRFLSGERDMVRFDLPHLVFQQNPATGALVTYPNAVYTVSGGASVLEVLVGSATVTFSGNLTIGGEASTWQRPR